MFTFSIAGPLFLYDMVSWCFKTSFCFGLASLGLLSPLTAVLLGWIVIGQSLKGSAAQSAAF